MKNQKISIIIPVYMAGEKFIHQCLTSVLSQTYKNFEVIIVCDKGTDNSHLICQEYSKKYDFIRYIEPENRLGLSHARNVGLDNVAKDSAYVSIIDIDDWIEPDYYETLVKNMEDFNADISICNSKSSKPTKRHIRQNKFVTKTLTVNQTYKKFFTTRGMNVTTWDKLLKISIIGSQRFNEKLHYSEDCLFFFEYFQKCKTVAWTSKKLYHYIRHNGSMVMQSPFPKRFSELKSLTLITSKAPTVSQTAKIYSKAWLYILAVEKIYLLRKLKNVYPNEIKYIKSIINENRPFFRATKKHQIWFRKLIPIWEKFLGI